MVTARRLFDRSSGPTDRQTDRQTDGWTDRAVYRVAYSRLKTGSCSLFWWQDKALSQLPKTHQNHQPPKKKVDFFKKSLKTDLVLAKSHTRQTIWAPLEDVWRRSSTSGLAAYSWGCVWHCVTYSLNGMTYSHEILYTCSLSESIKNHRGDFW